MKKRAEHSAWSSRIFFRYFILQLPGWILLCSVVLLVNFWVDLPTWVIASAIFIIIIKDFILYPIVWRAYDQDPEFIAYQMIGKRAVARDTLFPSGYVQINGELWKAEVMNGIPVEKGQVVKIRGLNGLTLLVQPEDEFSEPEREVRFFRSKGKQ